MELSPLLAELERLYGEVAAHWFKDRPAYLDVLTHDRPAINIASRGRKVAINGWYTPAVWSDAVDDVLDFLSGEDTPGATRVKAAEITIASEVLGDPVVAVAELARQMLAHVVPQARPKEGSFYYNSMWSDIGLIVGCTATVDTARITKGYSLWTPGTEFQKWAVEAIDDKVWNVSRDGLTAYKHPNRMRRWSCQCTIIRSATIVTAKCTSCGHDFVYTERGGAAPPKRTGKRVVNGG